MVHKVDRLARNMEDHALGFGGSTTLVTWDAYLASAASRIGCAVAPPLVPDQR